MAEQIRETRDRSRDRDRDNNNRTHDPNLRELTAELDGLRATFCVRIEGLKEVLEERHRLYTERLEGVKDHTNSAFTNSEKAFLKAEQGQKDYNEALNNMTKQIDAQNKATIPRAETEHRFRMIEDRISEMRETVGPRAEGEERFKSIEDRLSHMRETVGPRTEIENRFRIVEDRLSEIRELLGKSTGKETGMDKMFGYTVTMITLVFGFIGIALMIHFK